MRLSRRRSRRRDPLALPETVRGILDQLRRQCPNILPGNERQLARMLESVRHYERSPTINEGRGRPRRWSRDDVAKVSEELIKVLERKTGGRVLASSFVSLYLPILQYPTDITAALREGNLNIGEASYLARLTSERMGCSWQQARKVRAEVLKVHLLSKGSQNSLRLRVKAILGELPAGETKPSGAGLEKADELVRHNPYDARHLFYEEIQLLADAMQQVEPDELKGKKLDEFLRQIDKLLNMLRRARRRYAA
jgi:hypothetical protein